MLFHLFCNYISITIRFWNFQVENTFKYWLCHVVTECGVGCAGNLGFPQGKERSLIQIYADDWEDYASRNDKVFTYVLFCSSQLYWVHFLRYKNKILFSYFRASGDSVAQSPVMQNSSNEYNFPSDSESLKMVRSGLFVNITGFDLHQIIGCTTFLNIFMVCKGTWKSLKSLAIESLWKEYKNVYNWSY